MLCCMLYVRVGHVLLCAPMMLFGLQYEFVWCFGSFWAVAALAAVGSRVDRSHHAA